MYKNRLIFLFLINLNEKENKRNKAIHIFGTKLTFQQDCVPNVFGTNWLNSILLRAYHESSRYVIRQRNQETNNASCVLEYSLSSLICVIQLAGSTWWLFNVKSCFYFYDLLVKYSAVSFIFKWFRAILFADSIAILCTL